MSAGDSRALGGWCGDSRAAGWERCSWVLLLRESAGADQSGRVILTLARSGWGALGGKGRQTTQWHPPSLFLLGRILQNGADWEIAQPVCQRPLPRELGCTGHGRPWGRCWGRCGARGAEAELRAERASEPRWEPLFHRGWEQVSGTGEGRVLPWRLLGGSWAPTVRILHSRAARPSGDAAVAHTCRRQVVFPVAAASLGAALGRPRLSGSSEGPAPSPSPVQGTGQVCGRLRGADTCPVLL